MIQEEKQREDHPPPSRGEAHIFGAVLKRLTTRDGGKDPKRKSDITVTTPWRHHDFTVTSPIPPTASRFPAARTRQNALEIRAGHAAPSGFQTEPPTASP